MYQKNRKWKAGALPLVFMVGIGVWTAAGADRQSQTKPSGIEAIPVRVMRVAARDMDWTLEYVGDIKGEDEAVVYSRVSGKVVKKLKEDGTEVQKGEVIAYVDRDEVGLKFEPAPVESPLAGMVGRVYVDRGTSVSPQTPIALIVNMDKAKINLDIPEKYLPQITVGQAAQITVDAYTQCFTGQVSKISPVVDLQTRTAPVEILALNPAHYLKSGMFARVRLLMEQRKGVLVVIREAILGKEPDQYVYVVHDGVAQQRKVRLGLRQASEYEVLDGLKQGELVVIMGQQRLNEGAKVAIEEDRGSSPHSQN